MSDDVGHLEAAALKRKARLQQLKAKKARKETDGQAEQDKAQDVLPKPLFRSYRPADESLKEGALPDAEPGEVRDRVREELDKEDESIEIQQLDFTNLAPRKPDWDLKRDIGPKLEKLERRTHRAIAELIRERLAEEDLANAVTAGASAARTLAEED